MQNSILEIKVKINPTYDLYIGECLLEKIFILGHQLCEVRWQVLFLAAFVCPNLLLLESEQASNPWLGMCLKPWILRLEGEHSNHYPTHSHLSWKWLVKKGKLI